jgi:hydrogenase nickel incorporation protein HypB
MRHIAMERKILNENDRIAAALREKFERNGTLCVNFISSPGSGKTALLERTLAGYDPSRRVAVLTGDIQTDNDARRLSRYGFPVRQITTGGACHLDGRMIERGLVDWQLEGLEILFIENVGNLVCPTSYDLGEEARVVLLSVTEGEDKPLKYPATFFRADLMLLNKIDLLPYVPFDAALGHENARRTNPEIEILNVSCTTGEGFDAWLRWLEARRAKRLRPQRVS